MVKCSPSKKCCSKPKFRIFVFQSMPRPRLIHRSNKNTYQKHAKSNNLLKYSSITLQTKSRNENDNISDTSSDVNTDYYAINNFATKNNLETKNENFASKFAVTFFSIFNAKIIKRILTTIFLAIVCSAIIRFT